MPQRKEETQKFKYKTIKSNDANASPRNRTSEREGLKNFSNFHHFPPSSQGASKERWSKIAGTRKEYKKTKKRERRAWDLFHLASQQRSWIDFVQRRILWSEKGFRKPLEFSISMQFQAQHMRIRPPIRHFRVHVTHVQVHHISHFPICFIEIFGFMCFVSILPFIDGNGTDFSVTENGFEIKINRIESLKFFF